MTWIKMADQKPPVDVDAVAYKGPLEHKENAVYRPIELPE